MYKLILKLGRTFLWWSRALTYSYWHRSSRRHLLPWPHNHLRTHVLTIWSRTSALSGKITTTVDTVDFFSVGFLMKSMQTPVVRADKLKIWQFPELPKHRYCQEQHIWELRIAFPSVDGWSNQEFPSQKSQHLVSHFGSARSLRRTTGSPRFAAFVPWHWPKGTRLWGREWENVGIRSLCACLTLKRK